MIVSNTGVPDAIRESVTDVELALEVTHSVWREDGTLLGYIIKDDTTTTINVYPIRDMDIGQLYAMMDLNGLQDYVVKIHDANPLQVTDSIVRAEDNVDLDGLKALKLSRLRNHFDSIKIRPRVGVLKDDQDVPRFYVDGSKDDITNFESYRDLLVASGGTEGTVKDADGVMQTVTVDELNIMIMDIKQFGLNLYQLK